MAAATFLAFLATVWDGVPDIVNVDDCPRLVTQPSGVIVLLPVEFRKTLEK